MTRISHQQAKEQFLAKLDTTSSPTGCWLWTGCIGVAGYGACRFRGPVRTTHRLAYELLVGPIPDGMLVCHRCDVRHCCNPEHLFVGTNDENMHDMAVKGRGNGGARRLTIDQVRAMRLMYAAGSDRRTIATQFGVYPNHVSRIINRTRWRYKE